MNAFKTVRESLQITKAELARQLGYSRSAITLLEVGARNPSPSKAVALVKLGQGRITLNDIFHS